MYLINEATVDLLERIQKRIDGRLDEMDAEGAGESEADNETDIADAMDLYLNSLANTLLDQFDASEDEVGEFIVDMAMSMAEDGVMPPFPGEDATDDQMSLWLGAAKTVGFVHEVLKAAQ